MPNYNTSSYNTYNISGSGSSTKKRVFIGITVLVAFVGLGFAYRNYNSDTAKVDRLVGSYYAAQSSGDEKKMKSMESKELQAIPVAVLGASTDKSASEKGTQKISIAATKVGKKSAAVTGTISASEKGGSEETPFLVQATKQDGKWKVAVFNIGLLSTEDQKIPE